MQLFTTLLASLAACALAAPTIKAPPTSLVLRDVSDPGTYCSDNDQGLTYAIGELCSQGVVLKPNDGIRNPSMVEVMTDKCPTGADLTDMCLEIMWKLCAAQMDNGYHGAIYHTGPNRCQTWMIVGNGDNMWDSSEAQELN